MWSYCGQTSTYYGTLHIPSDSSSVSWERHNSWARGSGLGSLCGTMCMVHCIELEKERSNPHKLTEIPRILKGETTLHSAPWRGICLETACVALGRQHSFFDLSFLIYKMRVIVFPLKLWAEHEVMHEAADLGTHQALRWQLWLIINASFTLDGMFQASVEPA